MKMLKQTEFNSDMAQSVAPEDLRIGDMVAEFDVIYQIPSYVWDFDPQLLAPEELVYLRMRSDSIGRPLKIESICLPYILVATPAKTHETLDLRRSQLVRLTRRYADLVFKKTGVKKKRKKRRKKNR